MPDFSVIVVNGPPASGKTHLASRLALDLGWLYISKDHIKESLFDSLGYSDRSFSKKLGEASFALLLQIAAKLSATRIPFIIDSACRASDGPLFLAALGPAQFLQIHCITDSATLLSRFGERASSGERHPGHVDHALLPELQESIRSGVYGILELPGKLIRIDTTNYDSIEYDAEYREIVQLCV